MSDVGNLKRLEASQAVLFVVDIQERFRTALPEFQAMLDASIRLVSTFRAMDRPIVVTEQYPQGLGRTVPSLREALGEVNFESKTRFSCCETASAQRALSDTKLSQAVVCGIETHVCVSQSVQDLIERGLDVFLPVDALASRKAIDKQWALTRMSSAGAVLSTTESLAFELLADANHPKFKEIQALFK